MLPTCAGQSPPPTSALSGCVRCPQGLPSPTWEGGGPDTAPWPQRAGSAPAQKPLEGWVSLWGAPTPSLTVAPGDLALREREPEPPAQHRLLSRRCRTRPGGRPGDGICAQAVSGAAAACVPGRPVGPALVSDGHLCLWQEKGEVRGVAGGARAGSPPAEAGARRLCLRSALGSPEGSGSSSVQALPPALSVCHSALLQLRLARALLGVARALLAIYFQHPDDRFRAAAGRTIQFSNLSLD